MIELANRMRDDAIKDVVKSDKLICYEAGMRMMGLGQAADQKQDDIYRVSQVARYFGRIVSLARQTLPNVSLDDLIKPCHFDLSVEIGKRMSTGKEAPALNVGRTVGNLLRKACNSKYCTALRTDDLDKQHDATNVKKLIDSEWNNCVNRPAVRQIKPAKAGESANHSID